MPEDVVAGEERALLLQQEAHVVDGVAGGEERADGRALGAEDLVRRDRLLVGVRVGFVDAGRQCRVVREQRGDPARVVAVPVGEEDVGDG